MKKRDDLKNGIRWQLVAYDFILMILVLCVSLFFVSYKLIALSWWNVIIQAVVAILAVFVSRFIGGTYKQIWRYAGTKSYLMLVFCDFIGAIAYAFIQLFFPFEKVSAIVFMTAIAMNLLASITFRFVYKLLYEHSADESNLRSFVRKSTSSLTGLREDEKDDLHKRRRINIAIVGAGRVGVMLADELMNNPNAAYEPKCFIDIDQMKVGRNINGLPVLSEDDATINSLSEFPIQEIIFAVPEIDSEKKRELYEKYKSSGYKLKVYDYPTAKSVNKTGGKRHMREFSIEELLFRNQVDFINEQTRNYYKDKVILISGGGGSIGSELSRQIAKMGPKKLIILDVYENGAYDIQQELKMAYGASLDLCVEIISICDKEQLEKVFDTYRPQIVLHAAAHKHVPLMEHNCCESVKNNVFGTLNIVEVSEKYGVEKFTMISTDKAVNPTNVMGATKRMCEMIVQSRKSKTNFSATRFGNVLGSNGSVIPLFKRQIANGGPVTLTDKRIIRYFMTIPEAAQLVLISGAMAKNGELFVLDMGKPVKILELAENMIRLSGFEPYKDINIIETGLRPGEKLYEELLIKNEDLDKTENSLIFIERDKPLAMEEISKKLDILRTAVHTNNDETVKQAMKKAVPTFKSPEEVNRKAAETEEMKTVNTD